jgi:glutamate synthase (NADPH/NADH) small chain
MAPDPRAFVTVTRRERPLRPITERLSDFGDVHLQPRIPLAVEQSARCMDCGVPFCHSKCPLGNLIPDWNRLVSEDRWHEAWAALSSTNNFPEFTGMLCPAPCEDGCVVAISDRPVTIKEIELTIAEHAWDSGWVRPEPPTSPTGLSVAIVGSGPAGLAAAQQLTRTGHAVTVFERDDRPGGLLRYGIPDFKQPKHAVDRRIGQMELEGTRFEVSVDVGRDIGVGELRARFDAVILATGAQVHRDLPLRGRDLAGIHFAMPYLMQRNREVAGLPIQGDAITAAGKRVAIIGAGDTSADCLGNVLRQRAEAVFEIGHGPTPPVDAPRRVAWPDRPFMRKTYPVHDEGGERVWEWETIEFAGEDHIAELRGRRRHFDGAEPKAEVEASASDDVSLAVDLVLIAIGFTGAERSHPLFHELEIAFTAGSTVDVRDHATSAPGVFAAGDCVLGADLIVGAIAEGRECARVVDLHLTRRARLPSRDAPRLAPVRTLAAERPFV